MMGATVVVWAVCLSIPFQLPYPVRGATVQDKQLAVIWAISIPAPREGCDISLILANLSQSDFNSRTP